MLHEVVAFYELEDLEMEREWLESQSGVRRAEIEGDSMSTDFGYEVWL